MFCNGSVLTAIPAPSQSSDEDIRLSVDVPSTLDVVSVCVLLHIVSSSLSVNIASVSTCGVELSS